ncbi:MAG TPA: RDD family protein [Kribbella sp.]|nr:RDD family protein [Kribbella sp.]
MSEGGISPVPREARPYQGQRAGAVSRLAAAVIDALLVALVLLAGYAGVAGFLFLIDPRGFSFPELGLIFSLTAAFIVLVVYLTVSWWITGRSYGGLVMGLRVVGRGGEDLRFIGALVRALLCAVAPIGLLWVAVSPENRSLQDVLLRTAVIYDWQPRSASNGLDHPAGQA